jgi:hypothetical protein
MDVKQCLILWQMYCKGLFTMIDYFLFIEIHHLAFRDKILITKDSLRNIYNVFLWDMMQMWFSIRISSNNFYKGAIFVKDLTKKFLHLSWANINSCEKFTVQHISILKLLIHNFFLEFWQSLSSQHWRVKTDILRLGRQHSLTVGHLATLGLVNWGTNFP